MKVDLHVHTRGSDGTGQPWEIAQSAKAAGLDGLAITDHHKTHTAEGLEVARACRALGLVVFSGCEYSALEGHVLVFGVDVEELAMGLYPPMQTVIDRVNAAGGVVVPSHPYHGYRSTLGGGVFQLQGMAGVEVANGQCAASLARVSCNEKAARAAMFLELPGTGGSDAHDPRRIGACYTEFPEWMATTGDLVAALKKANVMATTTAGSGLRAVVNVTPVVPAHVPAPGAPLEKVIPAKDRWFWK
jgi:hypothetical protein